MYMPIYEYRCSACSRDFEELVSMSTATTVSCPDCGSRKVAKQLSSFQRVKVGAGGGASESVPAAPARSGGCCGGGCGCG
jgi:putative FmdB family regulatory protein